MRERFEPALLDLGTFAEEAQIAARAGDQSFLASRAARRYLDWVLSQPNGTLPREDRNTEPIQLPEQVTKALRTLHRKGATLEQHAEAADTILGR